jgi:hypothetical protein
MTDVVLGGRNGKIYICSLVMQEFGLIDKKELAPLQELIESIIVPY